MNKNLMPMLLMLLLLPPSAVFAADEQGQPPSTDQSNAQNSSTSSETGNPAPKGDASNKKLKDQYEAFETRLEATETELHNQKQQNSKLKEQVTALASRLELVESQEDEAYGEGLSESERTLDIYGFFDVELFYFDISKENAAIGLFPGNLSFMLNRINLYISSQMTETLSMMLELRFTFLPHAYEKSYQLPAANMLYERIDTTVIDPLTGEDMVLGGLSIVRANMTWQPFSYLAILVGRYLTPFGIWNLDHGSPVIIPVRPPYLLVRNIIPRAQTGAQVLGRVFPTNQIYLDYAITISNGRGPTETVYDLDNNKALGFRIKGTYEKQNFKAALGGYLYWGEATDIIKDIDSLDPVRFAVDTKENYTELTGAIDLLLTIFGLRLQGEYIRGAVTYNTRPLKVYPVVNFQSPLDEYQPDFNKWCTYGLIAYRFRFETNLGKFSLTPFFMYEYNVFDETSSEMTTTSYNGGLTFSPSPFVTLKYELSYIEFPDSVFVSDGIWMHSGQVAISF